MIGSVGSFFFAVSKCAHAVEADFAYKFEEFLKVLFCFTWETHHERGAQADTGHFLTHFLYEFQRFFAGNVATHEVEYVVRDVLKGDVKIVADIVVLPHDAKEVEREASGVGVVEAYPFHAGNLRHLLHQLR